jgi:hypothetical protein
VNRSILTACLPCVVALAVSFVVLVVVLRLSGGRWQARRIAALHRCQEGGVQTLSFVLTLPLLVMILLFIVQVSQLMTGIVQVNYAAFASARAASVWIPAHINDGSGYIDGVDADGQNELPPLFMPGAPIVLSADSVAGTDSRKLEKVFAAAAIAMAPAAPSRTTSDGSSGQSYSSRIADVANRLYPQFDSGGSTNPRIARRIQNKLGYSFLNTYVELQFDDRNSQPVPGTVTYNPIAHPDIDWYPSEVGWQDPITVTVYHDFALLPGPGRFLAKLLVREDGRADNVAPRIREEGDIYTTRIRASATMTNEGLMSVRPYNHPREL